VCADRIPSGKVGDRKKTGFGDPRGVFTQANAEVSPPRRQRCA